MIAELVAPPETAEERKRRLVNERCRRWRDIHRDQVLAAYRKYNALRKERRRQLKALEASDGPTGPPPAVDRQGRPEQAPRPQRSPIEKAH